jgi:hypothetical protein
MNPGSTDAFLRSAIFVSAPGRSDALGYKPSRKSRSCATPTSESGAKSVASRSRPFSLPDGCICAYYPEATPLVPAWHHDQRSKTPA